MSFNDGAGLTDEVYVELNQNGPEPDYGPQPDPIPARPDDDADLEVWVDYVVALGADRDFVTEDTQHFKDERYATAPAFSRERLIALADRLGG